MAREALDEWAALMANAPRDAIVVISEMTTQDHGWSGPNGDNAKSALYAGMIDSEVPLSDDVPPLSEVRWPDGSTSTAPLISAANALDEIRSEYSAPCPECTPVHVVAVELVSHLFDTARGRLRLPAWEFTLREGNVHLYRVAAANAMRVPSDGRGRLYSATWTAATNELTVQFVGSPCSGRDSCDGDYTAASLESNLAVVVMVLSERATPSGPSLSLGQLRTVTVTLDEPLGNRTVLDISGAPVSVQSP